jgi:hypothetical protein
VRIGILKVYSNMIYAGIWWQLHNFNEAARQVSLLEIVAATLLEIQLRRPAECGAATGSEI